jgi:hypothetical protein
MEAPPRTFTMKDKFEYFKPSIQVEMDNFDKPDTVTEMYIRGNYWLPQSLNISVLSMIVCILID